MTYPTGEALILARLQEHADYNADNCRRANWRILNSGTASVYAILRPGPAPIEMLGIGGLGSAGAATERSMWTTQVMVYKRLVEDGDSATELQGHVADVISQLQQYRYLGATDGTIQKARVNGVSEIEEIEWSSGVFWLRQVVNVEWHEERKVSFAE